MQKLEFNTVTSYISNISYRIEKVFFCFTRQTGNHVSYNIHTDILQVFYCCFVYGVWITPPDVADGVRMNGL